MRKSGVRGQGPGVRKCRTFGRLLMFVTCLFSVLCLLAPAVFAQEDAVKLVETKRMELKEKEAALKKEEERLSVLRKEVDGKIESYSKLLAQVEAAIKKVEQVKGEKMENVVKAYEGMSAGEAAARLAVLDADTALQIMSRMKSKKAGAIIASMEPHKAAALTKSMATLTVKRPEP